MILNRVRPSLFMAVCMFAWAIVSTLTFLVQDYKGMMIARFILGVTEAPVSSIRSNRRGYESNTKLVLSRGALYDQVGNLGAKCFLSQLTCSQNMFQEQELQSPLNRQKLTPRFSIVNFIHEKNVPPAMRSSIQAI